MYEKGNGVEKDVHQAAEWYKRAAEQGDAKGQAAVPTTTFTTDDEVLNLLRAEHASH